MLPVTARNRFLPHAGSGGAGGVLLLLLLLVPAAATAQSDPYIAPGLDCFETHCGSTTWSFCDDPIPAGFFGPGCDAFDGVLPLRGRYPGSPDTLIERLRSMVLFDPGESALVPIEMVALDLVGCEPVTVQCPGGPEQWEVSVDLSVVPSNSVGRMTVTKTHPNGGIYLAELPVQLRFTFMQEAEPVPLILIFDTGLEGRPAEHLFSLGEDTPWVHSVNAQLQLEGVTSCAPNFAPGVRETAKGKGAGAQCCAKLCQAGANETHCVNLDQDCVRCRSGACCFPGKGRDRCRIMEPGGRASRTAMLRCASNGGVYQGDGTNCDDTDGDGIPDVFEKNNSCAAASSCSQPTSPALADTDGDGVSDSDEQKAGTDPTDPASF